MLYILDWNDSEIVESEEVENGVILDFNKDGKVVGIEILDISQKINAKQMKILQFETEHIFIISHLLNHFLYTFT